MMPAGFITKRILRIIPVFLIVTLLTMLLLQLGPADPARQLLGEEATQAQVDAVNERFGFDDPLPTRYANWLGDLVTGDFGSSYRSGASALELIRETIPVSFELALLAIIIALGLGIPLAMWTALRQGRTDDRMVGAATTLMISLPSFVIALVLVFIFAIKLGWFPVTGWVPFSEDPVENLRSAFLPALALSVPELVIVQRVLRADLIGTLDEDYIQLAKAKGLSTRRVMFRHALRPSSFSLLTIAGLSFGRLIGGTVVVETIFGLPGLGRLLISSIYVKDLTLVQGIVTFLALLYIILNLLTDLLYGMIDPRLRTHGATT